MLEILAPCGSPESLDAALNAGADAVYLGLSSFSARRNAANFSPEELKAGVKKAHRCGVKVYAAINTLVFDDELEELEKTVQQADDAGVNAVIVQDHGAAAVIREIAPRLRIHASTQMTVTSASGANFAAQKGFKRVVLPRELSFEEIRGIVSEAETETEVFVHGALCVCLSGQCLLSAVMGGRSGNRGLCAQPCRLNYVCGGRENVLSLKDLSLIDELKRLEAAGVTSAKIEGRMKRPEYVAAAVGQCRAALRGEKTDIELLRSVFSRSGFTKGYFDGSLSDMSGIRQKEDAENTAEALKKIRELYKQPAKRFKIDFNIELRRDKPVLCRAKCSGFTAEASGAIPQTAVNRSTEEKELADRISKLGGTVFEAGNISCTVEKGLTLPAAAVNELRRSVVERLSEQIEEETRKA
ncbi:MAG: U32 family peptidase [Bacteroides sp.]|nr:U32 family peptidase [Bacteroides sp.]